MNNIKFIDSNFASRKDQFFFKDGLIQFIAKKQAEDIKTIEYSKIRSITYEKPEKAFDEGHWGRGLIAAVFNVFSATKSMSKSSNLTFDISLFDGGFLVGKTDKDTYFTMHKSWLNAKAADAAHQPLPEGEVALSASEVAGEGK